MESLHWRMRFCKRLRQRYIMTMESGVVRQILRWDTNGRMLKKRGKRVCSNIVNALVLFERSYPLNSDIVARLSVYSVPSSAPAHMALVPHFLPPRTSLPHTLVIIVLDWTKPWSFLEQLQTWLTWVEDWVKSDNSRDVQVLREEGRDRCEFVVHNMLV